MQEFKKNKTKQNPLYSLPVLGVLSLVILLFGYNTISLIEKNKETSKKKKIELSNIETLRIREEKLKQDISNLETNSGVEEVIRDKFLVGKSGEKVVVIVDKDSKKESDQSNDKDKSFWSFLKR